MLEIKDKEFFMEIVADAISQAGQNISEPAELKRWTNAIAKSVAHVEDNPTFIHWVAEDQSLLIWSDSNEIYAANGTCQCKAYETGMAKRNKPFPCWHRALARIVRHYYEFQDRPAPFGAATAKTTADQKAWRYLSEVEAPRGGHYTDRVTDLGTMDRDTYAAIYEGGNSSPFTR